MSASHTACAGVAQALCTNVATCSLKSGRVRARGAKRYGTQPAMSGHERDRSRLTDDSRKGCPTMRRLTTSLSRWLLIGLAACGGVDGTEAGAKDPDGADDPMDQDEDPSTGDGDGDD